jgi:hypothetical protein
MLELGDPQRLGLHQRDQTLGGLAQFGRVFGQRRVSLNMAGA